MGFDMYFPFPPILRFYRSGAEDGVQFSHFASGSFYNGVRLSFNYMRDWWVIDTD